MVSSLIGGAAVAEAVPLAPLTTLRVGPVAQRLITCDATQKVVDVMRALGPDSDAGAPGTLPVTSACACPPAIGLHFSVRKIRTAPR